MIKREVWSKKIILMSGRGLKTLSSEPLGVYYKDRKYVKDVEKRGEYDSDEDQLVYLRKIVFFVSFCACTFPLLC